MLSGVLWSFLRREAQATAEPRFDLLWQFLEKMILLTTKVLNLHPQLFSGETETVSWASRCQSVFTPLIQRSSSP